MNKIVDLLLEHLPEVISAASSLIIGILALLTMKVNKRLKKENASISEALEKARIANTYVICPHCGNKVLLKELVFYLPGDKVDNNLDGLED